MRKIKEILFSENGMKAVNTLFFLAMLFYWSGLLFVGLAVVMIGVSLYGLIQG